MSLKIKKNQSIVDQEWVEPLDWFFSPLPAPFPYPSLALENQDSAAQFHRALYPFSADYYQKLIPLFLCLLKNNDQFEGYDSLFLRDGAVGLLHFIQTKKELIQKSSCRFFVHYKLKSLIPSNLLQAFSFYDFYSDPPNAKPPKKLLISGTFFNEQIDLMFVEKQLSDLALQVGNLPIEEIDLLFTSGASDSFPKDFISIFKYIENRFNAKSQICHWKDFAQQRFIPESLSQYYYLELNSQVFYSDSFVQHYALKKGAKLLTIPADLPKEDFRLPLSPYHGLKLWENLPESKFSLAESDQKIIDLLLKSPQVQTSYVTLAPPSLPWNHDFSNFVQSLVLKDYILGG